MKNPAITSPAVLSKLSATIINRIQIKILGLQNSETASKKHRKEIQSMVLTLFINITFYNYTRS